MRLINPRTYKGGGLHATPLPIRFSEFLSEDITSAPDVFSSCLFIPRTYFESSSVMVHFSCMCINSHDH